jgi:glycoside/pentoside/hexuronide:cation symporter, GPH family
MSIFVTKKRDKVPVGQKAAFGAGHLVLNLLPGSLGFLSFFLLTAFGMDPLLAGLLSGLPRIFDALTDPIMGFISDNTKSRYGRRRPYIFVGAILSGILFALLWQLDETNTQSFNFWYFLSFSMLFLIGNTMFATPLVGLGYEMTSDYNERTRLMSFANSMGQIAWMIVPWFWVIIANPDVYTIGADKIAMITADFTSNFSVQDYGTTEAYNAALNQKIEAARQAVGVRHLSVLVGVICLLLGVLPSFFCKGIDAARMENLKDINFRTLGSNIKELFQGIKEVSKNKPFMRLCGATFLVFNGFQMVAAFSVFIIVFSMYNGDYGQAGTWPAWFSTITALITAMIVIPVISWMANTWGKRQAFIISTTLSIIGYILKWWGFNTELNQKFNESSWGNSLNGYVQSVFNALDPILQSAGMSWFSIDVSSGGPWLIFIPIPLIAFGLGGLFTLMMSMTADVCDLDELRNGMPRKEGTFGAIYWWMVKLGQALALVLGGLVLKLVGFDQNSAVQAADTMLNLRLADIFIPAITAALAIAVMWNYSLSEERAREIKAELVSRRGEL